MLFNNNFLLRLQASNKPLKQNEISPVCQMRENNEQNIGI